MRLRVCILTPGRVFQREEAEELILPTCTGQIGILNGHAPLITALDIGVGIFRRKSNWTAVALIGGFALVSENQVTMLVNEVETPSSVTSREAEKSLENVTNRLNQVIEEKERLETALLFKRARARYLITKLKTLY